MQWRLRLRTGQTDRLADPLLHNCKICSLGFGESVGATLAVPSYIVQPQTEQYLILHNPFPSDKLYLCLLLYMYLTFLSHRRIQIINHSLTFTTAIYGQYIHLITLIFSCT
jgi:hypothetical protein